MRYIPVVMLCDSEACPCALSVRWQAVTLVQQTHLEVSLNPETRQLYAVSHRIMLILGESYRHRL